MCVCTCGREAGRRGRHGRASPRPPRPRLVAPRPRPEPMLAKAVHPFHFKVFFSNKYVHAAILNKLTATHLASVSTNNRLFAESLGPLVPKTSLQACELAGKLLAQKAARKKVRTPAMPRTLSQVACDLRREFDSFAGPLFKTLLGQFKALQGFDCQHGLAGEAPLLGWSDRPENHPKEPKGQR